VNKLENAIAEPATWVLSFSFAQPVSDTRGAAGNGWALYDRDANGMTNQPKIPPALRKALVVEILNAQCMLPFGTLSDSEEYSHILRRIQRALQLSKDVWSHYDV